MAEKEHIEREAVNALIKAECSPKVAAYLIDAVATIPAADVRPVGLLEQVEWERDTALAQLAEIGKSLGEKMDDVRPVVTCERCVYHVDCGYHYCNKWCVKRCPDDADFFCAYGEEES